MLKHTSLKQQLVAIVAGIALVIVVAGASTGLGSSLAKLVTPDAPAIACNSTGQSGGGC